ncbi:MAG: phosphoribosylanthranilate isomerase [Candidatus Omnitrophica bacterium]|nr:phosphoribosylanthranilate isomerase [Candidatus Omnitrophota bacterium]
MAKVKICGLTNIKDAEKAEGLGADYLGFIFFDNSPRFIPPDEIKRIIESLHGQSKKVGLFLDQDINFVRSQAGTCKLDVVQLHGTESPGYVGELKKDFTVIKTFRLKEGFDFNVLRSYEAADFYLFDTFVKGVAGGTGIPFDWGLLEGKSFDKPMFLAGGLNPDNVRHAIDRVRPFVVDVASGVEKMPGKKDHILLEKFIKIAKTEYSNNNSK